MESRRRTRRRYLRKTYRRGYRRYRRKGYPLYRKGPSSLSFYSFSASYTLNGGETGVASGVTYNFGTLAPRRAFQYLWLMDPELGVFLTNARDRVIVPQYSSDPWYAKLASLGQFRFAGLHLTLGILSGKTISNNLVQASGEGTWTLDVCYVPNYHGLWRGGTANANDILFGATDAIASSQNHRKYSDLQQRVPMHWGLATPRSFMDPAHSESTATWKQLRVFSNISKTFDDASTVTKVYQTDWSDVLANLSTGVVLFRLNWYTDVLVSQASVVTFDPPDLNIKVDINYRSRGPIKAELADYNLPAVGPSFPYQNAVVAEPGRLSSEIPELVDAMAALNP